VSDADAGPTRRVRLAAPALGDEELAEVAEVFRSGALTNGPATSGFEREFADHHHATHGVAFANGTVALTAMYLGLGIGPGDEVVVPSMTFISTATSVVHVGARPVFAEVDAETFNLDPADAARRITPRPKAILAVHYAGQAADLDELRAVADHAGVPLLEDAAEAHGATYKGRPVGAIGRAGMFSFTPTKNITTGEGGMVLTDDAELAAQMRLLRNHGQTALYEHTALGYNWRLSDILSAVGRAQLRKLPDILARKRELAARLSAGLADVDGVHPPVVRPDRDHVFMIYTTLVDGGRDALRDHLLASGIEARLYFPPVHRQAVFAGDGPVDLPVTDDVAARMLSLPIHARLTDDDIDHVVATIAAWRG
jgi:perosamine synthetase